MRKQKFTDEQIAFVLKQVELGASVGEVCRKGGISEHTFSGGAIHREVQGGAFCHQMVTLPNQ